MEKRLTDKQKRFVEEYCVDFNATQAAIRAGYSKKTAKETGYENLTKPHIKNEIDKRIEKRKKKLEVTEKEIIAELAKIGFSDMSKYYEQGFELKDITTLPIEFTSAIKEVVNIKTDKTTRIGIKLYAKVHALELLGKHLGMWQADQSDKDWHVTIDYVRKENKK